MCKALRGVFYTIFSVGLHKKRLLLCKKIEKTLILK